MIISKLQMKKISVLKYLLSNNNIIIIVFTGLEAVKIYFYDIKNKSLDNMEIKWGKKLYMETLFGCFNIDKDLILLSIDFTFIIINSKTKQINTKIKTSYRCIRGLIRMKTISLIEDSYKISQMELKSGEIYQNYCALSKEELITNIVSILDLDDNLFCSINGDGSIFLYKYTQ